MRTVESPSLAPSLEIRGTPLPCGATDCTTIHAVVARAIWPSKTAEHWAAAAGVKPRMAKYWLAGSPVSADGKLPFVRLLAK
jgi:hypothetical protein